MAFVPEAALIALREGLEAFLIVGILLGVVVKLDRPDARKWVWGGFAAAVVASVALGIVVQRFFLVAFEARGGGEWFELVAALAAVGVLTYMVFWMWQHTRTMLGGLRKKVAEALTQNTLFAIAFLAFASVLREGLEVVLFYSALGSRNSALDLAWSGLLGALLSIAIVLVILRTTVRFDLARFFGVTGILLVFVAAGLLVHSVHAAQAIGILPASETALWDTSGIIPNDRADGRILHALFGYEAAPNLLQALLYFGYLFGVGIPYLWQMGVFHRNGTSGDRHIRRTPVVAVALLILLATAATAYGAGGGVPAGHGHGHGDGAHQTRHEGPHFDIPLTSLPPKVGVLLRVHGEPVHYNASTYESFRMFYSGILESAGLGHLLKIDEGTMLLDTSDPFCERTPAAPTTDLALELPTLHDAWTRAYTLPATIVPDPLGDFEGCLWNTPGGPGAGEPDILETMGLGTWRQWMKMDGTSPMYETQSPYRAAAATLLEDLLGDRVVVEAAAHIEAKMRPGEGEADAIRRLVDAGVDVIVDAYGSAMHSDVMDGCMMSPHVRHGLAAAGFKGTVLKAGAPGRQIAWADAVVAKVTEELGRVDADTPVALLLTHHGLSPNKKSPCHDRLDPYHDHADALYANVLTRLNESGLDTRFVSIQQVYGQAAEGDADPEDVVASSEEAFRRAKRAGARLVLDIPYELSGDGFDNLVAQREHWGFTHQDAPYYSNDRTTTFIREGVTVHITSSAFGHDLRATAWAQAVLDALADAYGDGASTPSSPDHDHGTAAAPPARRNPA